jgi:hypothetical protein
MFNTLSAVGSTVNATVGTMVNVQGKVQCIIWLIKSRSTVTGQCNLHRPNGRDPVSKPNPCWYYQLQGKWKCEKVHYHLEEHGHQKKMVNA